jgi:membrane protease YdiL (CAAX protease family)
VPGLFTRKLLEAALLALGTGLLLRWSGERFAGLGLDLRSLARSILPGLAVALVLFVVVNAGINVALGPVFDEPTDRRIRTLFRDPREAPWWIGTAIVGGGFAEELGRAFALTRFERLLGRAGLVAALLVDAAVFGLGHLYQGRAAAISSALTGLALAGVFLWRRRVTDAMAAHAWFDLLGIAAAYALYGRRG